MQYTFKDLANPKLDLTAVPLESIILREAFPTPLDIEDPSFNYQLENAIAQLQMVANQAAYNKDQMMVDICLKMINDFAHHYIDDPRLHYDYQNAKINTAYFSNNIQEAIKLTLNTLNSLTSESDDNNNELLTSKKRRLLLQLANFYDVTKQNKKAVESYKEALAHTFREYEKSPEEETGLQIIILVQRLAEFKMDNPELISNQDLVKYLLLEFKVIQEIEGLDRLDDETYKKALRDSKILQTILDIEGNGLSNQEINQFSTILEEALKYPDLGWESY